MNDWEISDPIFEADEINEKLRVAPWEGHRNFAYDLLKHIDAEVIVELGTHYGCSLFAFAQSLKDHNLTSQLFAVDTWQGDEQAGYYGEEVINKVNEVREAKFDKVNVKLLRKTFDEALEDFEDNSIQILHIDGLHTYEAVSHDYKTWLPKVAQNGIILFHDVYSPLGYGSNRFWQEIKREFPHYEFHHSWGLGVLFPKGDSRYKQLESVNFKDKSKIYEYKALFAFEKLKNNDLDRMVVERDKSIASIEKMVVERDLLIAKNDELIAELKKAILNNEQMIVERDNSIRINEQMIVERDNSIRINEQMIVDRDNIIKNNDHLIQQLRETISNNERLIEERDSAISSIENLVMNKDRTIAEKDKQIQDLQLELKDRQEIIEYYRSKKIIFNFKKRF